jgi:OmcA/MtrC family decaheme c-type cytochrome
VAVPIDSGGGVVLSPAVAPGLNVTILDISFPVDLRPVVQFEVTDDSGSTVALSELTDARFILAHLVAAPAGSTARYLSYIDRIEDPDGTPDSGDEALQANYDAARLNGLTQAADGTFTYKFEMALPVDYERGATHQIGGQFRRLSVIDGETYRENVAEAFRPDGRTVTETREIVTTETCNSCHTRLSMHGNIRREVQLCILCHNAGTTDAQSGNTVDMAEMIHKIHRGADLPSVEAGDPYQIFGFRNSLHDYSTVHYPQEVENCTSCHVDAPQADIYLTSPTIEGCASCHDRTWFNNIDQTPEGYTNHVGGMHADNRLCAQCHTPTAPGASPIYEAHLLPSDSESAPGLALDIANVTTAAKGEGTSLTIDFTAVDGAGNPYTDLSEIDILAATVAYPVPEYQTNTRETIQSSFGGPDGTVVSNGGGSYSYTFASGLPTGSLDTFAVALEGRVPFIFRGEEHEQGTATNGLTYFTLDGSDPVDRRSIVDETSCNVCHEEVRMHGELRTGVNFCVMCHNPNNSDIARRPAEAMPPETINFKDMIHLIHTGEELTSDYTVYGFGGVAHDFTHVRFPGARQECNICHVDGATELPLSTDALSTVVFDEGGAIVSEVLPERSSCTSCHDDTLTGVHAALATEPNTNIESCAVCHGPGAEFAVSTVHHLNP